MKRFGRDFVVSILAGLLAFVGVRLVLQQYTIEQTSMSPTLENGQHILITKPVPLLQDADPERGEIIVFNPPDSPGTTPLIKRVVGLPGETVEINSGHVYVNGALLDEPYIKDQPRYSIGPVTVPPEHYFVLGDNRNNSRDSHVGWTVPEDDILGTAWLSIWPPDRWGLAPSYAYASH